MSTLSIPWWKKLLSYLVEIRLEELSSEVNETLVLSLVKNRLQLSTEKSIYSYDDLYTNFYRAFEGIELPPDGSDLLVLGLGLGSIPFILEKFFHKNYSYVAIELDEAVIELASKFSLTRLNSQVQIIHTDAEHFVRSHHGRYPLVMVDLFVDDVVPSFFESIPGNELLADLLTPGGQILFNRLYRTGRDKQATDAFYEKVFSKVYRAPSFMEIAGNRILVGKA